MRINGWHRLWLVASLAWLCIIAFYTYFAAVAAPLGWEGDVVRSAALIWVISSLAGLVIGYGVAWAIKGFMPRDEAR